MSPCVFFTLEAHAVRTQLHLVVILTTWLMINGAAGVPNNWAGGSGLLLRKVRSPPHSRTVLMSNQPGLSLPLENRRALLMASLQDSPAATYLVLRFVGGPS